MSDNDQEFDVLRDLLGQADSVGNLLAARGAFENAFQAFRAEDSDKFQAVLKEAKLSIHCERICHWIRTKECVFLCLDLAGPPKGFDRAPDPRVLASAIAKMAEDDGLVQRVADILVKRDAQGFREILDKLGLVQHAHLFCHWLCLIRYRLVCRWICHAGRIERPVLWLEIQNAGRAIGALLGNKDAFRAAVAASTAGESAKLGIAIRDAGLVARCHWVCEFFCSWRYAMVCLLVNKGIVFQPVMAPEQIREARDFGAAIAKLSQNPADLMRFSAVVGAGDAGKWAELIKKFGFERFSFQLCHWICGWRCFRFCKLVCIDIHYHPWFTHIGDFSITGDISPANGLTVAPRGGHGGPDFGFGGNLSLRGFCPKHDPAHLSEEMSYRFLFQPAGAPAPTPITGGFVAEVLIGTRYTMWNGSNHLQTIRLRGTGANGPTPTSGPDLEPPDLIINPDADGWVKVDQAALDDAFSGYLMGFASGVGLPVGPTTTSVAAGTAVPVAEQKNGSDSAIIFQATRDSTIAAVNGGGAPDYSNMIAKVRINNWHEVAKLDILQFHSGGGTPCSPLGNALDIEFTVDHELLRTWSIGVSSASGETLDSPPVAAPPPSRGAAGTHHQDISTWPTCSYTVTLFTQRRITDGLGDDPGTPQSMTFCIGRR
jgi:hypothetical protein